MVTTNFSLADVATISVIVGTACTAFGLLFNAVRQAIKDKWDKRQAKQNSTVEEKRIRVSEREAETHEVEVLFEGFRMLNEENRTAAAEAKAEAAAAHKRIDEQNQLHEQWKREIMLQFEKERKVRDEIIDHVQVLEAMIPNPPGPPTRPNWQIT